MTTHDRFSGLSEPLNEHSRLVRRPGVQIGMLGDDVVLFQPDSLVACILDEHAAWLWLDCVGQPFSELIETACRSFDAEPRDIVDLFRILRLFEMVGDSDASSTTDDFGDRICSRLPRCDEFHFRGELINSGELQLAIIGSSEELCTVDLTTDPAPGRNRDPITIVIIGGAEESEQEVEGLEAITALARSVPDPQIDVLIRLILNYRVLLRPEPTD
jgi:hypothetical protein